VSLTAEAAPWPPSPHPCPNCFQRIVPHPPSALPVQHPGKSCPFLLSNDQARCARRRPPSRDASTPPRSPCSLRGHILSLRRSLPHHVTVSEVTCLGHSTLTRRRGAEACSRQPSRRLGPPPAPATPALPPLPSGPRRGAAACACRVSHTSQDCQQGR
jgi:hypothetical protein